VSNPDLATLDSTYPALVSNVLWARSSDSDTDDVGARVEQALRQRHKFLVSHLLGKLVHSHCGDQLLVADCLSTLQGDSVGIGVDLCDSTLLSEDRLLLGQGVGNGNPDPTSAITSGEAEGSVRTPVSCDLVEKDVLDHSLDIRCCDTLSEPSTLHLARNPVNRYLILV
jgi:hypothetical protein